MSDRLGQGALSEEPSDDALRAQKEWEEEKKAELAAVRYSLHKLQQIAEDALGEQHASELADPLWDHIEGEAA